MEQILVRTVKTMKVMEHLSQEEKLSSMIFLCEED